MSEMVTCKKLRIASWTIVAIASRTIVLAIDFGRIRISTLKWVAQREAKVADSLG